MYYNKTNTQPSSNTNHCLLDLQEGYTFKVQLPLFNFYTEVHASDFFLCLHDLRITKSNQ